jgi:hypothetical protein
MLAVAGGLALPLGGIEREYSSVSWSVSIAVSSAIVS